MTSLRKCLAICRIFLQVYPHITVEILAIEDLLGPNGMKGDPVARYQRIVSHADVGLWNIWSRIKRARLFVGTYTFLDRPILSSR